MLTSILNQGPQWDLISPRTWNKTYRKLVFVEVLLFHCAQDLVGAKVEDFTRDYHFNERGK